jgi:hypothetical protein
MHPSNQVHRTERAGARRVLPFACAAVLILIGGSAVARAAADDAVMADLAQARADCETSTELGRRDEAIASCQRVLTQEGSAADERAMVGALMSGATPPTMEQLAQALALARNARMGAPAQPWGYAAMCDIAKRIGDSVMLQYCSEELERIAPNHEETRRSRTALAALRPAWWQWLGWLLVAGAALGTGAHAFWQRVRRVHKGATVTVLAAAMILAAPGRAYGDAAPESHGDISAWPVDDKDPEKSIPPEKDRNRDPIQFAYWLMDLTARASGAAKRGDHRGAIKYYTAMAKAVPDRSIAFSKLCDEYGAVGEHANAVDACGMALSRDGVTVADYVHYMNLILTTPGKLNDAEVNALATVIKHLREDPTQAALTDELECEAGVRTNNVAQLIECTPGMMARAPNDPKTIVYTWNLAMERGRFDEARQILERARATQMKPEAIDQLETETTTTMSRQRTRGIWLAGGLFAVVGSAAFLAAMALRRRRGEMHPA